jgi:gamma-glutamyltranspeptidase/glutathione hydrolase
MSDSSRPTRRPVVARSGMVATSHPLAVEIGVSVLKSGGNAIDAAVATNAAMGLMEPMANGIGGDLFAIIWDAKQQKLFGLNGSGRSPYAATIKLFREHTLDSIPTHGPLSWSVPGCVDGWDQLLKRFGTKSLAELLAPSIDYADRGFATPPVIANTWNNAAEALRQTPQARATYLPNGHDSPKEAEIFRNPRLAKTYRLLAVAGRDAFYRGEIAERIVEYSKGAGGLFELRDFADHTSTWVEPVSTNYRGYDVWEIPPPGQGIAVLQILNLLEAFDLSALGEASADWWHLFIEAKKLAYADRATFYCDPQFRKVPLEQLISKRYADERRKSIDMKRAMQNCPPGDPTASDTIYLCVVDKDRNCVSLIQSVYDSFGSHYCAGDLGFILQNRGTSFALDENHANALSPHKRPFHTIIPSFVTKNGNPHFVFGVMGGDMQPQGQVQVLVNHLDFAMSIQAAGDAGRMMHSGSATPTGKPADPGGGTISAEASIPQSILDDLSSRGHRIAHGGKNGGGYQGILLEGEVLQGASESRRDGKASGY